MENYIVSVFAYYEGIPPFKVTRKFSVPRNEDYNEKAAEVYADIQKQYNKAVLGSKRICPVANEDLLTLAKYSFI